MALGYFPVELWDGRSGYLTREHLQSLISSDMLKKQSLTELHMNQGAKLYFGSQGLKKSGLENICYSMHCYAITYQDDPPT